MAFANLIETFNSNNLVVPVSLCSVLGIFLIFFLIKWMSNYKPNVTAVDVDDNIRWDKETRSGTKKTKQKKTKTTVDSSNILSRAKTSGKQPPVKVTSGPAKGKPSDEKPKLMVKKLTVPSATSTKQVQPVTQTQDDWTVAGSKKKQKNKKVLACTNDSKTEAPTRIQEKEIEETDSAFATTSTDAAQRFRKAHSLSSPQNVTECRPPLVPQPATGSGNVCVASSSSSGITSSAFEVEPFGVMLEMSSTTLTEHNGSPLCAQHDIVPLVNGLGEPVEALNSSQAKFDDNDKTTQEAKVKKTSKKKKCQVAAESHVETLMTLEKDLILDFQDHGSTMISNIKSDHIEEPEANGAPKGQSKSKSGALIGLSKDASKDAHKEKVAEESEEFHKDIKNAIPNISEGVITEYVLENAVQDMAVNSVSSQVAFDELGLKDNSVGSVQSSFKKKKKARRDV